MVAPKPTETMVSNQCHLCGACFGKKFNLQRHLGNCSERHVKSATKKDKDRVICDICDKTFSCKFNLDRHVKKDHWKIVRTEKKFLNCRMFVKFKCQRVKRTWICKICHVRFSTKYGHRQHQQRKHPGSTSSRVVTQKGFMTVLEGQEEHEEVLKCSLCSYKSATFKELLAHKKRNIKERRFSNANCVTRPTHMPVACPSTRLQNIWEFIINVWDKAD